MATYDFATINAQVATSLQPNDLVAIPSGTAAQTTLLYVNDQISITVGAQTVLFGFVPTNPQGLAGKRFLFPDGTATFAGDLFNNNITLTTAAGLPPSAGYGGAGNDTLTATSGSWFVQGNQGMDRIDVAFGLNTVYGGQDDDVVRLGGAGAPGGNFTNGNKGNDSIFGSAGTDTLLGGQGNDTIDAIDGADFLNGNLGNDNITGTGQLLGEGGNDTLTTGFFFPSTVRGGDGDDRIVIQTGVSGTQSFAPVVTAFGDEGNDEIISNNASSETLSGGAGNDTISATGNASGGDSLDGGDGNDRITARGGANTLLGGAGNDSLDGGEGAETFDGGAGFDTMAGGFGADLFIEDGPLGAQFVIATTVDRITHWEVSDHIKLRGAVTAAQYSETSAPTLFDAQNTAEAALRNGSEVVAVQVGSDVVIYTDISAGTSIHNAVLLAGRSLADISVDNFVY